jgi:hypothetical protein
MERDDATQEGITLTSLDATRWIAREEAERVILQHLSLCPFASLRIEERVRTIEGSFKLLIGLMLGSGLLGGATAAAITNLIAH